MRLRDKFKYLWTRKLAKIIFWLSIILARNKLKKDGAIYILIDSSVLGNGFICETAWISTGTKKWGNIDIETGYSARIPVHAPNDNSRVAIEVRYLSGIARLAKDGLIKLVTSAELIAEKYRQPHGRYNGYGHYESNVFDGIEIHSVDGIEIITKMAKQDQIDRIDSHSDPMFFSIKSSLPKKSNLDAWHIYTSIKYNLFCFLVMDFPLVANVEKAKRNGQIPESANVMLPSELGRYLGIKPIASNILSILDGGAPVHPEFHSPDGKRRKPLPEGGRMTIYGSAIVGDGQVATVPYGDPQEALVKKLPEVADMSGLKFDHSRSVAILTYKDKSDQWYELDVPLPQAMYLLSLVKGLQLDLNIPFPDDPRDPATKAVRSGDAHPPP